MKILFVLPIREGDFQLFPDLGILYLGSLLKEQGYDVSMLDCPKEQLSFKKFKRYIQEGEFDVVGFRCFSRDHNYVDHHLKIVKQVSPKTLTLVGGPHPSALPEFVMNGMDGLDFAWKTEAEVGILDLLQLYKEYGLEIPEGRLKTVDGLVWKNSLEDRIVINQPGFGVDLDSYQPDWSLLDPETYPDFESRKSFRSKIWDGFFHVSTTRGCPYPCTYCNAPNLSGKKLRHRSVEHVIRELTVLKNRYGAKRFSIIDDEFTLKKKYAKAFCNALIEADLNLNWDCPNGVRLDSLTPELLQLMEASGCDALSVGIESGNERIQKLIKKRVTVDTIRRQAALIADCTNIDITGYFMIGFLDETEEEIHDTINLACELPLVRAAFNVVIPIPGTAIFTEAVNTEALEFDQINWDTLTNDQVAFQRNHITGKRLLKLQRKAFVRFYSRPNVLWNVTRDMLKNRRMLAAGLRKLKRLSWRNEVNPFEPMYLQEKSV